MTNYYFNQPLGPTQFNLSLAFQRQGWQADHLQAQFSDDNLLSDEALQQFEYKHLLHHWLTKQQLDFAPQTWVLNDLTLHKTLKEISNLAVNHPWIIKPAKLNNGQGIALASNTKQLQDYFQQANRFSGIHVVQRYIDAPLLYQDRKFSLRMFVVLGHQQMYFHPHGYLNVCREPYCNEDFSKLYAHLTNEHLFTTGRKNNQQILSDHWHDFEYYLPEIQRQCNAIFLPFCMNPNYPNKQIAVLGVDFMIDLNKRVWLLEVNHGPCFPTDDAHPLFNTLYKLFWDAAVGVIEENLSGV